MPGRDFLDPKSLVYVTYFADNISAGMDRKCEGEKSSYLYFDKNAELEKIFNIFWGRHDNNTIPHDSYNLIRENIKQQLIHTKVSPDEINSLLNLLEATCSTIPSSTNKSELVDVSLYDHAKTTTGIALCLYDYLKSLHVNDYRDAFFSRYPSKYYREPIFLLFSCDMSGIQDFIYNISGSGALKQLRARSLYLEIMIEHIVDELLEKLELNRANLLYTGGGHAYLLLPNTPEVKQAITLFQSELKEWFLSQYQTDLFLASAWIECSPNDLMNKGEDKNRFSNLFRTLSSRLSDVKASRYSAKDIWKLNFDNEQTTQKGRECRECHRTNALFEDNDICEICNSFASVSKHLIDKDVFCIVPSTSSTNGYENAFPLPFSSKMIVLSRESYLAKKPEVKRIYTKNSWDTGIRLATHIWMGDYTAPTEGEGISAYAHNSATSIKKGIQRLGVLRADIDDLGAAFVSGIPLDKASISRTTTLSRSLSYFFKYQVNKILEKGEYQLQVIYSGGDDLFIIGNWSDVLYASIDIKKEFEEFTGNGCLTISAGIGMFDEKYPVAIMASKTGALEERAKGFKQQNEDGSISFKNAIALWDEDNTFSWNDFVNIIEPRMREIATLFNSTDKGKAFVYKMIALLRNFDDISSAPRLAYLLARSFEEATIEKESYRKFYDWALEKRQRRCLIAALEWYVYSIREKG